MLASENQIHVITVNLMRETQVIPKSSSECFSWQLQEQLFKIPFLSSQATILHSAGRMFHLAFSVLEIYSPLQRIINHTHIIREISFFPHLCISLIQLLCNPNVQWESYIWNICLGVQRLWFSLGLVLIWMQQFLESQSMIYHTR